MEVRLVQNLMLLRILLKFCDMGLSQFVWVCGFREFGERKLWVWRGGKRKRSHA